MSELAPIHRLVLDAAFAIVAMPILDWLESNPSRIFRAGRRRREPAELTPARNHHADPADGAGVARGLGLSG
jgi:hypothetical protein